MIQIASHTGHPEPIAGSEASPFSVADVTGRARRLLERRAPDIWVSGEVSRWARSRAGTLYITLRDDASQLRVVALQVIARSIPFDLPVGMSVEVRGRLSVYGPTGEMQLTAAAIRSLDERGQWQREFDRVRTVLESEGLLDPRRRREIPMIPGAIGVVTSPHGAALQDVLAVLQRRFPLVEVVVAPTRVQGRGAEREIAEGVASLSRSGVDVLIVTRGGGSLEDLWPFNAEQVARAIVKSPVPVISAVGHETDVTIADLVADQRAPTPSAAAQQVVPDGREMLAWVKHEGEELKVKMQALFCTSMAVVERGRTDVLRGLADLLAIQDAKFHSVSLTDPAARMSALLAHALEEVEGVGNARIRNHLAGHLNDCAAGLAEVSAERITARVRALVSDAETRLEAVGRAALLDQIQELLARAHERLTAHASEGEALSPRAVQARGWALVRSATGEMVRHPGQVSPGETIRVSVAGGTIHARVEYINIQEGVTC